MKMKIYKNIFMLIMFLVMVVGVTGTDIQFYHNWENTNTPKINTQSVGTAVTAGTFVTAYPTYFSNGNGSNYSIDFESSSGQGNRYNGWNTPTNALTISVWINPESYVHGYIIDNKEEFGLRFYISDSQQVAFGIIDGSKTETCITYDTTINLSEWTHIGGVWTGSRQLIYINGILKTNQSGVTSMYGGDGDADDNVICIGRNYDPNLYFDGRIDDTYVFNKSLTPTEMYNLYSCNDVTGCVSTPTINLTSPVNDTNINTATDINFNLTDGGLNSDCNFYVDDVLKATTLNLSTGGYVFKFNSSVWSDGTNIINITCNNSEGLTSETLSLFVDDTKPVIDYAEFYFSGGYESEPFNNSVILYEFYHNISVSDSNLYSFNLTVSNASDLSSVVFSDYVDNIGATNYVYNNLTNPGIVYPNGGTVYQFIEVCDGHTDILKNVPYTVTDNEINLKNFKFKSLDLDVDSVQVEKTFDRLSPTFTYKESKNILKFRIESTEKINIVKNSEYKGHIIIGKYWIDFENYDGFNVDSITQNKGYVDIILKSVADIKEIKLKSIGIINCVNITNTLVVDSGTVVVKIVEPLNNTLYVLNNTNININFTYYYNKSTGVNEDICSLYIDNVLIDSNINPSRYTNYSLNKSFVYPSAQTYKNYSACVRCTKNSGLNLSRVTYCDVVTITLFNNATVPIVIIPATENLIKNDSFDSIEQGLFYIFLFGVWVTLLYMTFTVKGKHGKSPQILNIAQGFTGFFVGINYLALSQFFGLIIIMTAVGVLVGKWIE